MLVLRRLCVSAVERFRSLVNPLPLTPSVTKQTLHVKPLLESVAVVSLSADLILCNLPTVESHVNPQPSFNCESHVWSSHYSITVCISFCLCWDLRLRPGSEVQRPGTLSLSPHGRPPGGKRSLLSCVPSTCLKTPAWVMTSFWRVNHI